MGCLILFAIFGLAVMTVVAGFRWYDFWKYGPKEDLTNDHGKPGQVRVSRGKDEPAEWQ